MRTQPTPFTEMIQFRAPNGFLAAASTAARRDHTSMAEFLPRTVLARLREVGLPLSRAKASLAPRRLPMTNDLEAQSHRQAVCPTAGLLLYVVVDASRVLGTQNSNQVAVAVSPFQWRRAPA